MIVGHYAAALVPYSKLEKRPLWLLLVCANVPEFLWLLLALLNIEPASPPSIFDATFQNLKVSMTYSHNLIPALMQGVVVIGVVQVFFRDLPLALWCGVLTVVHVLSDLIVGFEHQLMGPDSVPVSLNTYGHAPYLAILIELAFALACIFYFQRSERRQGRPLDRKRLIALYAVFTVGILMWMPAATMPLRDLLSIVGINLGN